MTGADFLAQQFETWLLKIRGIPKRNARSYAQVLVDEGYNDVNDFIERFDELKVDKLIPAGHCQKISKAIRAVAGSQDSEEDEPQLPGAVPDLEDSCLGTK